MFLETEKGNTVCIHSVFGRWELMDCLSVSEGLSRIQVPNLVQSRLSPAENFDFFKI